MISQTIHLLDDATINQIAAGEVIENPASVVKELIENSLDSGASDIYIETRAGGRNLIKVSDDGCGMSSDDLLLAVERHATSKISKALDLDSLCTLGFRGEALPSIASVSKFSIHSSQGFAEGFEGAILDIEGGKLGQLRPLPRLRGTTIEVKSLFFNTPVRKKFQKSLGADTAEIHKILTRIALSFPHVGFSWECDGQNQLNCPKDEDYNQRIASLLGDEWTLQSIPVQQTQGDLILSGRIGKPSQHRPNRMGQYLFINHRSVISPWISSQVLESYGTRLSNHRYPLFVLYFTLPPSLIDVNVHPQKREVRLREEARLKPFIHQSIQSALEMRIPAPLTSLSTVRDFSFKVPSAHESVVPYFSSDSSKDVVLFEEPTFSIIGKVKHYFFVEEAKGIRVVDGLRATERIVFDQLHVAKEKRAVQTLLLPIQLHMKGKDFSLLTAHLTSLNELGISIRPFGGDTFLVDAIPTVLEPQEIPEWIQIYLEEGRIPKNLSKCLKRGTLSLGAGASLVKKLFQCHNPDYTPSGKVIHYLLNSEQLDRIFL